MHSAKAGMANIDNLKFWAVTMLIFIGIGVVDDDRHRRSCFIFCCPISGWR